MTFKPVAVAVAVTVNGLVFRREQRVQTRRIFFNAILALVQAARSKGAPGTAESGELM